MQTCLIKQKKMVQNDNNGKKKKKNKKKKSETTEQTPPPVNQDTIQRSWLKQKSKTLTDFNFKRKTSTNEEPKFEPDNSEPSSFDRKPSSFRKRINSFIQNYPIFKKSAILKHSPSLRQDINRLSDSLENLKIDEGKIIRTKPIVADEGKTRTLDQFKVSLNSLHEEGKCSKCVSRENSFKSSRSSLSFRNGSLLSLRSGLGEESGKNYGRGLIKRSFSLQSAKKQWPWPLLVRDFFIFLFVFL